MKTITKVKPAKAPLSVEDAEKLVTTIEMLSDDLWVPLELCVRIDHETETVLQLDVSLQIPYAHIEPGETAELSARAIADAITAWSVHLTLAAQEIHRRYPTG